MIKKLFYEQYKNFHILLRNLSSLLLLVIGPLVLILLIGYAFSSEEIHGIKIGVVSENYEILQPAFQNFSSFGEILMYGSSGQCIADMALQRIHICLEFSENFAGSEKGIDTGTITFYYDNSRKKLSNEIIDAISDFFGVEAEKISIESAKTMLGNIQSLVGYLESKNEDIFLLINESYELKENLQDRHDRLLEIREEFLPQYFRIKRVQSSIDNISMRLETSYSRFNSSMMRLEGSLYEFMQSAQSLGFMPEYYIYIENGGFFITQNISFVVAKNLSYYNLSDYDFSVKNDSVFLESLGNYSNVSIDISGFDSLGKSDIALDALILSLNIAWSLESIDNDTTQLIENVRKQKAEFDNAVMLLDEVKLTLDSDISATEEYIVKIDKGVERVSEIQRDLNSSLVQLEELNPDLAEKLIKPIIQNYEPLLPGVKPIKVAFPSLLAIVVIFISILFSNIVTLQEINSTAFHRNIIAPVNNIVYIIGLIITNLLVVLFQVCVLLLVGQFSFRIDVFSAIIPVSIVILLLSMIFITIGMICAIILKNEQTSILTATFLVLAFFLFSNSIAPIEVMPEIAGYFASLNPFTVATNAFGKIIIFNASIEMVLTEVWILLTYVIVLLFWLVAVAKVKLGGGR